MEGDLLNSDIARSSAPSYRDSARHSLTIAQTAELFAQLKVPRSKRSVQRFCEQGHLDCILIKGPRGDQFFINRQSVERYAEELRQIDAVATIGAEARDDAPEHAVARSSALQRATPVEAVAEPAPRQSEETQPTDDMQRLKDENLNLRIDNRAKEIAIGELNRRLTEDRDKFMNTMQDMSYKLGAAETRLEQLQAPKENDEARQSATDPATAPVEAIILSAPAEPPPTPQPEPPRGSFLHRLFG